MKTGAPTFDQVIYDKVTWSFFVCTCTCTCQTPCTVAGVMQHPPCTVMLAHDRHSNDPMGSQQFHSPPLATPSFAYVSVALPSYLRIVSCTLFCNKPSKLRTAVCSYSLYICYCIYMPSRYVHIVHKPTSGMLLAPVVVRHPGKASGILSKQLRGPAI